MEVDVSPSDYQNRMADRFAAFDRDGDGSVTAGDFEAMALKVLTEFGLPPNSGKGRALLEGAQQFWGRLCEVADTSRDGEIAQSEFVDAASSQLLDNPDGFTEMVRPWAKAVIAVADTDNDGMVDAEEWARMLRIMGALPEAAQRRVSEVDLDRDGAISVDEVIAAAVDSFTSAEPRYDPLWAR
jgi:Ca2+-binding EF-hand superfamily protein